MLSRNPYAKGKQSESLAEPKSKRREAQGSKAAPVGKNKSSAPKRNDVLHAEVLALGGNDDDYKMISGLESDSEVEGDNELADEALAKEVAAFAKKLNIPSLQPPEVSDEDDDDSADEETPSGAVESQGADSDSGTSSPDSARSEAEGTSNTKAAQAPLSQSKVKALPPKGADSHFVVDPRPDWTLPPFPASVLGHQLEEFEIKTLERRAEALLREENERFDREIDPSKQSSRSKNSITGLSRSDQLFIQQVLSSGTAADKTSALLLLVASSPIHSTAYLEQLLTICKKKSRDESQRAVRGVVDWWCREHGGCPPRKLKAFQDQQGLAVVFRALQPATLRKGELTTVISAEDAKQYLVVWAFEDWLKKWFFRFLASIEQLSNDPLPHVRGQAVLHLSTLLREKPEQEQNVLRLLVNKLGDTSRSVASKTSHHLLQVIQVHPGIRPILVREISQIIFASMSEARGTASQHQVYYGAITLNQIVLRKDDVQLANLLLQTYLALLDGLIAAPQPSSAEASKKDTKKGKGKRKRGKPAAKENLVVPQTDSKLVAAVLTGINRAWPYGNVSTQTLNKHISSILRACKEGSFNVSIQALITIHKITTGNPEGAARLRRVLYESLNDPRLRRSSKQALYLNLVYRVTKEDTNPSSRMAVLRRLIQIVADMDVIFALGALWIIGRLLNSLDAIDQEAFTSTSPEERYNGLVSDPAAAKALKTPLWELTPLAKHWHPSVSHAASELLAGRFELASTELEQHSLPNFLDRMAYREHRKSDTIKGPSAMQANTSSSRRERIVVKKGPTSKESQTIVAKDLKAGGGNVDPDRAFFHTYFALLASEEGKMRRKKSKRKRDAGSDAEDEDDDMSIADIGHEGEIDMEDGSDGGDAAEEAGSGSELDEDEVWRAMQRDVPGGLGSDIDDFEGDDDSIPDLGELDCSDDDSAGGDNDLDAEAAGEEDESDDDAQALFEDEDDLLPSDADSDGSSAAKAKNDDKPAAKRRRKAKNVPMFASADDYAPLLANEADSE